MLEIKKCCLVVIDIQGKLAQLMYEKERLFENIQILIKVAKILDIPIIWCQQAPKALGHTIPAIAELLTEEQPVNKTSFSCCGDNQFRSRLDDLGPKQVILCGIETHVCVYQTALDLLKQNKEVTVIADAVSSRTFDNKKIAIKKITAEGAKISSVEMALFELLKTAEHPKFKEIAKLIK